MSKTGQKVKVLGDELAKAIVKKDTAAMEQNDARLLPQQQKYANLF